MNSVPFFNGLDKLVVIEANLGTNLLIKETLPRKLLSSLTIVGLFIVSMAVALAGSILIPL